jgi:hypothetical protein
MPSPETTGRADETDAGEAEPAEEPDPSMERRDRRREREAHP